MARAWPDANNDKLLVGAVLGGGFFLACEDFGRMFDHSFPVCTFFFFFFKVEISSRTLILLFMPGSVHSGSASWDGCGWMFPVRAILVTVILPGSWVPDNKTKEAAFWINNNTCFIWSFSAFSVLFLLIVTPLCFLSFFCFNLIFQFAVFYFIVCIFFIVLSYITLWWHKLVMFSSHFLGKTDVEVFLPLSWKKKKESLEKRVS